jgi:hypothetical protein
VPDRNKHDTYETQFHNMKQIYPIQISGNVQGRHIIPGLSTYPEGGLVSALIKRGQL